MNHGIALAAALAAPPQPASSPVDAALASAARYCEAAVTEKTAPPLPAGATAHSGGAIPGPIRRLTARPMIGLFKVDSYAHFHARNGQVWMVRPRRAALCDIVVTAVPGGSAALGASFTGSLPRQGWTEHSSSPATATKLRWRHTFLKWIPQEGSPNFGLMLEVRDCFPPPAPKTGPR